MNGPFKKCQFLEERIILRLRQNVVQVALLAAIHKNCIPAFGRSKPIKLYNYVKAVPSPLLSTSQRSFQCLKVSVHPKIVSSDARHVFFEGDKQETRKFNFRHLDGRPK